MSDVIEEATLLPQRTLKALDKVDTLEPELRELVHEFGYPMIASFMQSGVKNPKTIRQLILEVYTGARSVSVNRSGKAMGSPIAEHIDCALRAAGSGLGFRGVLALLKQYGMSIVPTDPSTVMVAASIEETKWLGIVSKEGKHKGRMKAAIEASERRMWTWLFSKG